MSRFYHKNGLGSNELGIELRLAIFEQHLNYFLKIRVQFIERRRLGMGSWETGHVSDVQSRAEARGTGFSLRTLGGASSHGVSC